MFRPLSLGARRLRCFVFLWLTMALVLPPVASSQADDRPTVAGRTMQQYVEELQSEQRVDRLRAVRSLGPFGQQAAQPLRQSLDHEDAAVRFLAAEQLGRLGDDALQAAVGRLCELTEEDPSRAVRLAASFALCRHGLTEMHLPLMIETLDYPERGMACTAAYLIGELGPEAKEAEASLQRTHEKNRPGQPDGDYHLGGAAQNALRKIRTP